MREGRIVADGPKREMLTAALCANFSGSKCELAERDGYYHLW